MRGRPYTCCFTGHRPEKLPWGDDETDGRCAALKKKLQDAVEAAYDEGMRHFICGMARGCDLYFAETVLALRERGLPLRLHCLLPCQGQEAAWANGDRQRYHAILRQADSVTYVSREARQGCMLARNRRLVESAAVLLAVYGGRSRSGTGATLRYARQLGREIIRIDPITRAVKSEQAQNFCAKCRKLPNGRFSD